MEQNTILTAASHNISLVAASIAVSLLAAFTGLAITNNIANLAESKRKALVVMSAFILGGGIWSMHFVAMLAHEFSSPVYYDSLQTLASALIAILVAGLALLLLHFSARTRTRLLLAGVILGVGIVVMHYVGMLGIRGVIPHFSITSIVLAILVAAVAGILAVRVAYGRRSKQNIVYGSVVFGLAVVAVHFTAMLGTSFQLDENFQPVPIAMANHTLAISVTVAAFVICGTFLLAATTFLTQSTVDGSGTVEPATPLSDLPGEPNPDDKPGLQIPFEKNKNIEFLSYSQIAAIRADGHYTHLYTKDGVLFCPWSITEAEQKLTDVNFHRTHRSYLVNIDAVDAFEKRKETGVLLFKNYPQLSSVPVSRNRIIGLSEVLKMVSESASDESVQTAST